ncbi:MULTISPECIES: class I SAM-dependent methyltransferase [Fructobacillus]|uniref:16S rRNA G1207 methylase RsmC (RsmC) n=1 Tax=Fructobacillus cardui TaxID=2893170 RepID=A0ABN9YVF9_9LACO|nr:methyltransferase [Fructobacillus sp. EFB-N1]KMK53602.1 Ribosomal RNA small subunit methyltransferase C [Fructobacillus sp. EFB-N1]CAK1221746.1 16S rRNA G1207 methylase RsmC (RsmC) [Fructobacillus cardui]CAK1248700.1 16S rRNA G1207 methylase RsmC (RsmC) [Fructobacillus cardui]CAK1249809.1 16S rRNA G1207 methylase RsmC (RsmC) [Fructobacillus cardui]
MTEKISGEQYFTAQPDAAHDYQNFDFELLGNNLHFTTDAGVFSKRTVDFGTRTMLSVAAETDFPAGRVLDLGTGYGPVGIAIAKALNKNVDMVDVNQRALDLAQKNANKNGVGSQVKVFQSNIYEDVQDQYALILVNPPIRAGKQVVTAMLQEAKNHLLPGGKLLAVLQKKQGAPSARKNLEAVFNDVSIAGKNKGYYVLEAVNG